MGNLIRNHPGLLVVLLLMYFTYGPYSAEMEAAKAGKKPESIDPVFMATRPAGARAATVLSPFVLDDTPPEPGRRSELPPAGAWLVDPLASARQAWEVTHSDGGPLHVLTAMAWRQGLVGSRALERCSDFDQLLDEVELPGGGMVPSFTLTLESLVAFSDGGGLARISGRDVRVGDEIPGFDPLSAPRLRSVRGLSVVIEYRGAELTLDLDQHPMGQFGPDPPGE
ncbi:MAG: hypothetical protein DRQ55_01985 [Planctomycetota bacterium]|nr:MAG: hypothetical protein DRQ55_01985 [Planctomycetota bacterium]